MFYSIDYRWIPIDVAYWKVSHSQAQRRRINSNVGAFPSAAPQPHAQLSQVRGCASAPISLSSAVQGESNQLTCDICLRYSYPRLPLLVDYSKLTRIVERRARIIASRIRKLGQRKPSQPQLCASKEPPSQGKPQPSSSHSANPAPI